jgi:predicted MFS family arabinose efflux permease
MVIGGMCGSVILSALSDKHHIRKIFLVMAAAMAVPPSLFLQRRHDTHISSVDTA